MRFCYQKIKRGFSSGSYKRPGEILVLLSRIRNIKEGCKVIGIWMAWLIVILISSCNKPEQPPLSEKEKLFINRIDARFQSKSERNIDVMLLGRYYNSRKRGSYAFNIMLGFETLQLLSQDSVRVISDSIVKELYFDVLDKNKKYDRIWLTFNCDTSNSKYKSKVFEYYLDTLKRYSNLTDLDTTSTEKL